MAKVKGVLFALSSFVLAMVLLTLSILIFHDIEESKERALELGSLDRVYDLYTSIEKGFSDIFNEKAKISVNIENLTISLKEKLPNDNSEYKSVIEGYQNYIESNYSNIKLNINEITNKLPLIIEPYNDVYQHNSIGGNEVQIISDHEDINSYIISITTTEAVRPTSCVWSVKNGDLSFNLQVVGATGTCGDMRLIDPTQENIININSDHILIKVNSGGLTITNNDVIIDVKTIISFKDSSEQVMLKQNNVINMTFSELGISKSGSVRIL